MGDHTVRSFDEELDEINAILREMGDRAGAMVEQAAKALLDTDEALAQRVISEDKVMDALHRDLDEKSVMLIGKRQPLGQDLRLCVGSMRMAGDLERIGDLAKNIGKRTGAAGGANISRELRYGIEKMANLASGQVKGVIALYSARKADDLTVLRDRDEEIDIAYTAVFRELLTYMMEDPRTITACTHLLFCAKNIERIGDHVTNIAENAYYMISGGQLSPERPKRDDVARGIA